MIMKIVTYILIALLIITLGAAAFFYLHAYQPMVAENAKMKVGMSELDRAKTELKKIKEKEIKETSWVKPAIDVFNSGLSDEIKAGKAEVLAAGNRVIVNIAEGALYLPGSYTFAKESPKLRSTIASLLKSEAIKGKTVTIGNTTQDAPAHGRGRKKIPAKDARTLAADRSAVLIKDLEKNGVNPDTLVGAAYASKQPEPGLKVTEHKTVIVIESPAAVSAVAPKQAPQSIPNSTVKVPAASPQTQTKPIPIQPAKPKTN